MAGEKRPPRPPTPMPFPSPVAEPGSGPSVRDSQGRVATNPEARIASVPPSSTEVEKKESKQLKGIAGSPGVAVGPALVLGDLRASFVRRHIPQGQIQHELDRIKQAVHDAKRTLREVSMRMPQAMHDATPILEAYEMMLADPTLHERVEKRVRGDKKCAEWAVSEACEEIVAMFGPPEAAERDAYISERRHDVEFVCDRLLRALVGEDGHHPVRLDEPMIVVARDLSPADTASMVREPTLAFVTSVGTRTSHTSIMARALEIPACVGVTNAVAEIRTGDMIIVDGLTGIVTVHPTEQAIKEAMQRSEQHLAFARRLLSARHKPCVTADGAFIPGDIVGDMTSIGTLFAFILVSIGVWIMRKKEPNIPRPFRVPAVPFVSTMGALVCGAMVFGLGWPNWLRLFAWLAVGLVIYFAYGSRRSKVAKLVDKGAMKASD